MADLNSYFRLFDPGNREGMIEIARSEAKAWNEKNYGIFWTVNQFDGPRQIQNLKRILAWYTDIDGNKKKIWAKIEKGIEPSLVIETKNGFQLYFLCEYATKENYRSIIENHIIPFYGGDPNAKDLTRVLRVPGFYHCKDPNNKFMVKKISAKKIFFTEQQIKVAFPIPRELKKQLKKKEEAQEEFKKEYSGNTQFDSIWDIDCMDALLRLSGNKKLGEEEFSFKKNSNGTYQIMVNGKSTSCWIDQNRKIGSHDKGGPSIGNWIRWYGLPWKNTIELLIDVGLIKNDKATFNS